ncbi:MAG TPA: hypothetical protein VFB63_10740, partial [Bryobacteraceae bacterium]|nr:hypothetical protein [Bryobacteraceae bacterium]
WFPTYTIANDTLNFESGAVRIRMTVKYEDYKRFGADTKITFGDPVTGEVEKKPEEKKKP